MVTVLPVKFKYSTYDLWFDPADTGACMGDHVVVSTERGCELGLVTRDAFEVDESELGDTIGEAELRPVLRIAGELDLERADRLADKGEAALSVFKRLADKSGLEMKPVAVEYLFGGERVVCYFSADERVDFRGLVRDLSHELQERIDMRQIGVREEASLVGGYSHCGQELCCTRFGGKFEPVSIRMAKEQDLPLNSNKISGACGRLMCCLRYEFEAYRDFKSRAPKKNALIDTPLGKAKIVEYDTPKEQICLRLENGKQIRVPLAEMEASPAACQKSKELGCSCRPDTVLRSTLDKILTPDIQMALAELDRKHGILPPEETSAEDDLFEAEFGGRSARTERRHRSAASSDGRGKSGVAGAHLAAQAPLADKNNATGGAASGDGSKGHRVRRRVRQAGSLDGAAADRRSAEHGQGAASSEKSGSQGATRRRRHHRADGVAEHTNGSVSAGSGSQTFKGANVADGGNKTRRRTRRPGDRGGQGGPGGQNGQSGHTARGEVSSSRSSRQVRRRSADGGHNSQAGGANAQARGKGSNGANGSGGSHGANGNRGPRRRRRSDGHGRTQLGSPRSKDLACGLEYRAAR